LFPPNFHPPSGNWYMVDPATIRSRARFALARDRALNPSMSIRHKSTLFFQFRHARPAPALHAIAFIARRDSVLVLVATATASRHEVVERHAEMQRAAAIEALAALPAHDQRAVCF
jgi:hypothetical protein